MVTTSKVIYMTSLINLSSQSPLKNRSVNFQNVEHPSHISYRLASIFMKILQTLLMLGVCASAQAQVLRCTDAKTGHVTYTNGSCISGESPAEVAPALSSEEIAKERAQAAAARERSQAQIAKDEARMRQREEQERKEQLALQKARASQSPSETATCRQARQRLDAILAEATPDALTWGERSQTAQAQMEMACLGPEAYRQLQQTRALQPNAINRPQWNHGYPVHPVRPQPPAKIVNCNVFRCYDNRGGVHPIP